VFYSADVVMLTLLGGHSAIAVEKVSEVRFLCMYQGICLKSFFSADFEFDLTV
jgi:hypothetical protein